MSAASVLAREKRFDWPLCYDAEKYILDRLEAFIQRNTFARRHSQGSLEDHAPLAVAPLTVRLYNLTNRGTERRRPGPAGHQRRSASLAGCRFLTHGDLVSRRHGRQ